MAEVKGSKIPILCSVHHSQVHYWFPLWMFLTRRGEEGELGEKMQQVGWFPWTERRVELIPGGWWWHSTILSPQSHSQKQLIRGALPDQQTAILNILIFSLSVLTFNIEIQLWTAECWSTITPSTLHILVEVKFSWQWQVSEVSLALTPLSNVDIRL